MIDNKKRDKVINLLLNKTPIREIAKRVGVSKNYIMETKKNLLTENQNNNELNTINKTNLALKIEKTTEVFIDNIYTLLTGNDKLNNTKAILQKTRFIELATLILKNKNDIELKKLEQNNNNTNINNGVITNNVIKIVSDPSVIK
jgi:hypothetical protein